MKSSIIFLGLVVLSFTSVNAANEFKSENLDQQELTTINVVNNQKETQLVFADTTTNMNVEEVSFFNPSSVIKTAYVKTVEDVIAENKSITDSKEEIAQPLSIDFTLENRIAEDSQIIESSVSNVTYPLDFEKINHNLKSAKVYNNNAIAVDLKL